MKQFCYLSFFVICLSLFLLVFPIQGEDAIYQDVIRLHVLANSDSQEDQAHKLAVRDAILEEWGSALAQADSRETAEQQAKTHISRIQKTAEETLRAHGSEATVEVTLTEEWYPKREYETFSLPQGTYLSLRVMIGEAEGKNWWCILYPPLCLGAATEGDLPLSDAEWDLMTEGQEGRYAIRFRILELLDALFS